MPYRTRPAAEPVVPVGNPWPVLGLAIATLACVGAAYVDFGAGRWPIAIVELIAAVPLSRGVVIVARHFR